jgi:hypothetical protein
MNEEYKNKRIKELLEEVKALNEENNTLHKHIDDLELKIRNHKEETICQSEIISIYNRPRQTLTRHIKEKKLVPVKIVNSRNYFRVSDVEEYVENFPLKRTVIMHKKKLVKKEKENKSPKAPKLLKLKKLLK